MREDPSILLMLFELKSSENLGFVPPIGSGMNGHTTEEPPCQANLNAGRGDPCAGQSKAVAIFSCLVMPLSSESSLNLGLALPIGSGLSHGIREIVHLFQQFRN